MHSELLSGAGSVSGVRFRTCAGESRSLSDADRGAMLSGQRLAPASGAEYHANRRSALRGHRDDTPMASFEHGNRHVWTGASPRAVRCAYMFCNASPSKADIERVRADIAAKREMHIEIDYHVSRS